MNPAAGPFAIASLLLAVGGIFKAVRPGDTANALRGVGLPGGPALVRVGGAVEVAIGCYALATGSRLAAALVLASYVAFAGFVTIALVRKAPISTCGCFGKADTPPSVVHVGVNIGAAAAALAVILDPGVAVADAVRRQPLSGVPFVLLLLVGTAFAFLALSLLPRLLVEVRTARSA